MAPPGLLANPGEVRLNVGNAKRLELKWKLDSELTSPPAVVDGRVYVTQAEPQQPAHVGTCPRVYLRWRRRAYPCKRA
jgi:hypothetical protein